MINLKVTNFFKKFAGFLNQQISSNREHFVVIIIVDFSFWVKEKINQLSSSSNYVALIMPCGFVIK
ncbi:MAG: hypothetical protein LH615_14520 [Ferruginibacter sp.]|nr:hypothetical protein [Ferruginibacter sp.]